MEIYREIEREWLAYYQKMPCETPSRAEFSSFCAAHEAKSRGQTSDGLQPWLGIFEFGLEWLAYIHIALDTGNSVNQEKPRHRVTWALIGSTVSFGLSLRTLCVSGFDTPARALLRSYVETLFLCLAVLHDEGLAKAYKDAQEDAEVKNFWHKIASPRNLHNRIIEIEKRAGFDPELIKAVTEYRLDEYEILSQSAHLSYVASCITAMAPVLGDANISVMQFLV